MNNKKDKKKKIAISIVLILLLLALLWGVLGSLTSIDRSTYDVYTIGNVEVKITSKGSISSLGPVLPNTTMSYSLGAKNVGINDAYVFMTIIVPCEDVVWVNENGVKYEPNRTQMLSYFAKNGKTVSDEWKLVDVGMVGGAEIHDVTGIQNNTENKGVVSDNKIIYVYGYIGDNTDGSLEKLAPDYETESIINYVKIANISNANAMTGDITAKLYAIQVTKLEGGVDDLVRVWDIVNDTVVE